MKNILPIFALLISMSGIALSLGREEVRCYIGLESAACPQSTTRETKPESIESSPTEPSRKENNSFPSSEPKRSDEPKPVKPPVETSPETRETPPENTAPPDTPPENTIPTETKAIEKNPPLEPFPEVSPSAESVPLEVIPPPESSNN